MRSRAQGDDGVTLVELLVSVAVMALAFTVIGSLLVSATRSTSRLEKSSEAVDAGRRASARIDRELRSATCIRTPRVGASGARDRLEFDTLADGSLHTVRYELEDGRLLRRQDLSTEGEVVVEFVGATTTAFTQVATPLRTVMVDLPIRSADGGEYHLTTTIAGRNAWRDCA